MKTNIFFKVLTFHFGKYLSISAHSGSWRDTSLFKSENKDVDRYRSPKDGIIT